MCFVICHNLTHAEANSSACCRLGKTKRTTNGIRLKDIQTIKIQTEHPQKIFNAIGRKPIECFFLNHKKEDTSNNTEMITG